MSTLSVTCLKPIKRQFNMAAEQLELLELRAQLAEKDKELVLLQKDKEILQTKHEINNMISETDRELAMFQLQTDKELAMFQLQKDKEILQIKHDNIISEMKRKHESEVVQLKKEIANANWEYFKSFEQLCMHQFIGKFEDKRLRNKSGTRNEKFRKFAEENEDALKQWSLTSPELFTETFDNLYRSLNQAAHPPFDVNECLTIPIGTFTKSEFRLLGMLWEAYVLPLEKFKISYPEKPQESVLVFKNTEL